jgi:hypothetical protein
MPPSVAFGAEMRRFERQHLPVIGQQRFDVRNAGAGVRGHIELRRLVRNDALRAAHVQRRAGQMQGQEILRSAAVRTQSAAVRSGLEHLLAQGGNECGRHVQKRGRSGCGSSP